MDELQDNLLKRKSLAISLAQTLMLKGRTTLARMKYKEASQIELALVNKYPESRFIHLLSAFWSSFHAQEIELAKKCLIKLNEMINSIMPLNDVQLEEIRKCVRGFKELKEKLKNA